MFQRTKMDKQFKPIQGYEGLYEINSSGQILSIGRKGCKGGVLQWINEEYPKISLTKESKTKRFFIHKLVAQTFIPNPHNKPQINHKDGNKYNPSSDNLEWCDNSYNTKHAYSTGLTKKRYNESNPNHKLKLEQIKEIGEAINTRGKNYGRKELAQRFNVSECTIKYHANILRNTAHVPTHRSN